MIKKLRLISVFTIVVLVTGAGFSIQCRMQRADTGGIAVKGQFSAAGIKENSPVPLAGEWEFYSDKLMTANFSNPSFAELPYSWRKKRFGCATYRLTITNLDPLLEYALKLPYQSTAYALFINGEKLAENGVVSSIRTEGRPAYQPEIKTFKVPSGTAELVLQVSNYVHRRGGPFQVLLFGLSSSIQTYDFWCLFIDGTLVILFLTSSLYQLSFFVARKKTGNLLLCLFFLSISSVFLFETPDIIIMALFPTMSWYVFEKLDYLLIYQMPLWSLLYINYLFRTISKKQLTVILFPVFLIYIGVLLLPASIYTVLNPFFQLYSGIVYLIIGYVIIGNIHYEKRETVVMLMAYLIFLASVLSNNLLSGAPFPAGNYLPLSFLKLIFGYNWHKLSFGLIDIFSCILVLCFIIISGLSFSFTYPKEDKQRAAADLSSPHSTIRTRMNEIGFSTREQEVLELLLEGKSNKEIADALFLSLSTVKTYISRIFKKTKTNSRAEVFSYLFTPDSLS